MLISASDYRYVDNARMFASGIHSPPHIIPERDGTASACIETYEDYCYLVEMARERQHWTQGGDKAAVVSVPASQFDPSSLVAKRGNYRFVPLQAIAHALEPDYIEDMGHDATCALIPHDASIALTTYGDFQPNNSPTSGYQDAEEKMRQGFAVARSTPTGYVVPRVLECDSMRHFYYDLGRMKRYMFKRPFSIYYPSDFNSWTSDVIWSYCQHVSYPVASTNTFTAVPFFGRIHYFDPSAGSSGEWVTEASYSNQATWNFYIAKPFYKNPVTGSAYYSSLQARLLFDVTVQNGIHQSGSFTMICRYNDLPVAPYSGTHDDVFEGVCSLTIDGSDLRPFYELAERWYETNVTPLDENEQWAVEITLNRIYFDTGAIEHVSNIRSSWTWQPS